MPEKDQKQLKNTVFLPQTTFPMQGNLVNKEPNLIEEWDNSNLYQKIRSKSKGREKFILHFGPPYANGHIHIGHALIGVLKDAVNKSYQMLGYDAPLVLGWDCHGLPIEWKIEEEYLKAGKKREDVPVDEFMAKCREFAAKWSKTQNAEFKRLGIIADFENPYSTMSKKAESVICSKFYEILKKGLVYRGKKPVMWSVVEKTALAEAELEYHDKTSDAIFVKFPVIKPSIKAIEGAHAVIWTTTPWTIPGNKAIAYLETATYLVIEVDNDRYIIAKDLLGSFLQETKIEKYRVLENIIGEDLKGTICAHPLENIGFSHEIPLLPGEHVTIETGTGLVHTAPAHGLEDFALAKKYDLPIEDTVNANGTLVDSLPYFQKEHVFKVNPLVISELSKSGNLIHAYQIVHSYPHSWRSKAPLIFRTTDQWFISISDIRDKLLSEIDNTEWFPNGYVNRIRSMVEKRPDWCISRQRTWGVPIALFIHEKTDAILQDEDVLQRTINIFEEEGIEAWHTKPNEYFLGEKYDPTEYIKVKDTLEVWFDSACSHHYVLEEREDLSWPANLYFEGSDQHRGWFQSSLVESCCTNGTAPYKQVATNGFVLDKDGKKMSKSVGNVVSPFDVIDKMGADILRLWCLNSDYSEDMRIGDEILKRQQDVYRRFRNTLRYLLGVVSDFDPQQKIDYTSLPDLEKLMLHNLRQLSVLLEKSIRSYNFQQFYSALHTFCTNDLSAFYFDIRKDSIYCDSKNNTKRAACLYVMNEIFVCVVHWLAPVLSFTAEEAWMAYPLNASKSSIHENLFPAIPEIWENERIAHEGELLKEARKTITGALEIERIAKTIGSSLEAEIAIYTTDSGIFKLLSGIDLAEIAIVSKASLVNAQIPSNAFSHEELSIGVVVNIANGKKCDRCWKILNDVREEQTSYGTAALCPRCLTAILQGG